MRKKTVFVVITMLAAVALLSYIKFDVKAEESTIKSHNNISMQSSEGDTQKVASYASDIVYLKNELDDLKAEIQ